MESQTEFRKQVREGLEHLYDTAYLETHPLLAQLSNAAADSRLTRAQKLRGLLKAQPPKLAPGRHPFLIIQQLAENRAQAIAAFRLARYLPL